MRKNQNDNENLCPNKIVNRWERYECDMFHTTVYLFVGKRMDMIASMDSYFTGLGLSRECIDELCKEICQTLPGEDAAPEAGDYLNINTEHYGTVHCIRLEKFYPGNIDDIMVLTHECLHAALRHMKILGIKECDNSSQECLCYFHENITKTFIKLLHKGHIRGIS